MAGYSSTNVLLAQCFVGGHMRHEGEIADGRQVQQLHHGGRLHFIAPSCPHLGTSRPPPKGAARATCAAADSARTCMGEGQCCLHYGGLAVGRPVCTAAMGGGPPLRPCCIAVHHAIAFSYSLINFRFNKPGPPTQRPAIEHCRQASLVRVQTLGFACSSPTPNPLKAAL